MFRVTKEQTKSLYKVKDQLNPIYGKSIFSIIPSGKARNIKIYFRVVTNNSNYIT